MIPDWLHDLSLASLALGVICAAVIALDLLRHPQPMWIMNLVWPVVALFGSLLALYGYFRYGRATIDASKQPFGIAVAKATCHCGSGCTLGDIVAEAVSSLFPVVTIAFGWHWLFPDRTFAVWVLDFLLAFLIGIFFQYFTISPMRGLAPAQGIKAALKADALSLIAWQVGMYAVMAVAHFYLFGHLLGVQLTSGRPAFWFMMQLAMLAGFATSYPVNWALLRAGLKEKM